MRDILPDLNRWHAEGKRIAIATVVQTWGSSPRRVGSKMVVTSEGQFSGSVSGGCVENAVIEAALEVIKTGQARLLHFGVADETAWEVGLACGGSIDIFVKAFDPEFFAPVWDAWTDESEADHITVIRGQGEIVGREMLIRRDETRIGNISRDWDPKVSELAIENFSQRTSRRLLLDVHTEIFLERISPPPTLIAVGGVHITIALAILAKTLGYRTVIVDPRSVWANEERFPNVDQLIQAWPQDAFRQVNLTRSTAIVMLTHDPKLDDPALKIALNSPAFYVGALGSKTTNAKRRERLLNHGLTEEQLSCLHAPIGLKIGAETPEEIALAIMSEVVSAYRKQNERKAVKETSLLSNL
jgi:xanthine dehydrogenase accessory factor